MMDYGYGNWLIVLVSIILFLYFLKSVFKPTTKTDWRSYKMMGAFFVALFAEMYGFPLTIYLLTSYLGNRFSYLDFSHNNGHILNTILGIKGDPHFSILHILSSVLIFGGFILIAKAWKVLYKSQKANKLAVSGVYHYIRHPQYTGFILIIVGFLLQWPTLITLIMAPILIFRYILLGTGEELAMAKKFDGEYVKYRKVTPEYIPSLKMLSLTVVKKLSLNKI